MKKWRVLLTLAVVLSAIVNVAYSQTLVGDWDGKGKQSVGSFEPTTAQWRLFIGGRFITFKYGIPGDLPIVGDWDGNGTTTIGIYRPTNGKFYLRNSNTTGMADVVIDSGATPVTPPAPPTPPVEPIVYDPTIPTLLGMVPNTPNLGTMAGISKGQILKYYLNLPEELPALDTATARREAKPKGIPYREGEINIFDPTHVATFKVAIKPEGIWAKPSETEMLTLIQGKNIPTGRYLITIEINQIAPGYNSSQLIISWGMKPPIKVEELTR